MYKVSTDYINKAPDLPANEANLPNFIAKNLPVFWTVEKTQIMHNKVTSEHYTGRLVQYTNAKQLKTSCARGDTICPCPARCGPPVHSLHALHLWRPVPWLFMNDRQQLALAGGVETGLVDIHYVVTWTPTKAARWPWLLTFWPWKWCSSHMWRGLPLCQFWSS